MEAVAALLRGLPLQSEESDRGDLMEAKYQLFLKYFTLFMNLLNDCVDTSELDNKTSTSVPTTTPEKQNDLRNATIEAMSNLLAANIDSGLMHSIGGYYYSNVLLINLGVYIIFLLLIHNNIYIALTSFASSCLSKC